MKKALIILIMFAVAACSSLIIKSLPAQSVESRLFKVEQLDEQNRVQQASLLSVQFNETQWRWVQTDPLGAPLARLILSEQGWQNDGFVMPNNQAKQLFSALATAFSSTPLFEFSAIEQTASGQVYQINHKFVWKIHHKQPIIDINLADGSRWKIEELMQ
ncbi:MULTISPECIES: hypothetical protein [Rodentibacter]|uniref:hypothetical protein n=1 Tax=Rodentibacter TaxID=1960084 RepID=UPI001CFF099A|nr:hypothetical protein [Rodentibacter sp. JRC1]GJI56081.1 hypothetical protein HEMROJRC1_11930 [Rodentibacter sp. JRC1]